jgi:hypothetical protein
LPLRFGGFGLLVSGFSPRRAIAFGGLGGPAVVMMGLASFTRDHADFAAAYARRSALLRREFGCGF